MSHVPVGPRVTGKRSTFRAFARAHSNTLWRRSRTSRACAIAREPARRATPCSRRRKTGVEPLRISKWSCGVATLPVWPEVPMTSPALMVSPSFTRTSGVRIGGDVFVAVAHQHEIAETLELAAGIDNDPVIRRLDRRVLRHRDVDAVIALAVGLGTKAGDDLAAHRPMKSWRGGLGPDRIGVGRFVGRRRRRRRCRRRHCRRQRDGEWLAGRRLCFKRLGGGRLLLHQFDRALLRRRFVLRLSDRGLRGRGDGWK